MSEDEYVTAILAIWPTVTAQNKGLTIKDVADLEPMVERVLPLSEEAVSNYPASEVLWCMHGELIQLSNSRPIAEAQRCFERALELDPHSPRANELLGDYLDAIVDDPAAALPFYMKAIESGGGMNSYLGLARTFAELGRNDSAFDVLSPTKCPFYEAEEVHDLIDEIRNGVWGTK